MVKSLQENEWIEILKLSIHQETDLTVIQFLADLLYVNSQSESFILKLMTDGEILISTAVKMIEGKDRDTAINFFTNLILSLMGGENISSLCQILIS